MKAYLRQCRLLNAAIFSLQGAKAFCQLGAAFTVMRLFRAAMDRSIPQLIALLLLNSLFWVGIALADRCANVLQAKAIARMNSRMRAGISQTLLARGFGESRESNVGEALSWYTNDVTQAETLGYLNYYAFYRNLITTAISAVALCSIHWGLLAVAVAATLLTVLSSRLLGPRLAARSQQVSRQMETFTAAVKDQLLGLPVLRSFGLVSRFQSRSGSASGQLEATRLTYAKTRENTTLIMAIINVGCQTAVNLCMFSMSICGVVPFETVFGGGNITSLVTNSAMTLAQLRLSLSAGKPFFDKHPLVNTPAPAAAAAPPLARGIQVEDLSFSYPGKPVFSHLSLHFAAGGKYALTGPSGCGKTTLLRLLLGQLPDYEGRITLDGQDIRGLPPDSLCQQMAYIPQDVFLFDESIRDNITLGRRFTQQEWEDALDGSALRDDLQRMPQGLDTPVGENGCNLSGGQRQRIAIARALLHRRSVLLVDEGTSALDQTNAAIVEDRLLQNKGLTLLLISHHLSPQRQRQFDHVYHFGCMEPAAND